MLYAGVEKPLANWGIKRPRFEFKSQANDRMTFTVEADVFSDAPFPYDSIIIIYRYDLGNSPSRVQWFYGWVSDFEFIGDKQKSEIAYEISGPWWVLSRLMYQNATAAYVPGTCALASYKTTWVSLFQNPLTGEYWNPAQQIEDVLTKAQAAGVPIAAFVVPIVFPNPPMEEAKELTMADVIRRALQWAPQAVMWFDHSSLTFNAQIPTALELVEVDMSAMSLIEKFNFKPRYDLVPPGVRFNYVGFQSCTAMVAPGCVDPTTGIVNSSVISHPTSAPISVQTITQDQFGLPDTPGGIVATINLQQLSSTASEPVPTGQATAFFEAWAYLLWQGSFSSKEVECSGIFRPGKVVTFLNANPQWAGYPMLIQTVTEELDSGVTTIEVGPPVHLGPQDFLTLVQMSKRRPFVQTGLAAVNNQGTNASPNCTIPGSSPATTQTLSQLGSSQAAASSTTNGGEDNANTLSIDTCNGGQLKTLKVYGPPQS